MSFIRDEELDIFPRELCEALAVDSGSDDEYIEEDFSEEAIRDILENNQYTEDPDETTPIESNNIMWSEDYTSFINLEETYTESAGPKLQSTDPFFIFTQIWDTTIMNEIVFQTNQYAWQTIIEKNESEEGIGPKSRLHEWKEVTIKELYSFFSILIYMGLCYRSRIDEYWSTGVLGMAEFRKIMSKNRFLLILRFLHFVDNYHLDSNLHGNRRKTAKIDPIVQYCNKKFNQLYTPRRHISLDESLLLWKGRLSWIQFIRSKAARFGIKTYELCEAETGYLLRMTIYCGKGSSSSEPVHGFTGTTSKVVLKLMDGFLNKGHCLVMDNYYNSVQLARFLKSHGTDVIGSLNRRRLGTPHEIKILKERSIEKGTIVARHCGNISVLSWKDVKLVTMISTYHNADTAPGIRAGADCIKPLVVHSYNKYMGGVDIKDQKLSMYLLERKRGLKWYIKVFRRLLNSSILNAYIMHQSNSSTNTLSHRDFRFSLAKLLSQQNSTNSGSLPRINSIDHYPDHQDSEIRNSGSKPRYKRGRCVNCLKNSRRTDTNIICVKCKVFLCVGRCWREYHSEIDD